MKKLLTAFTFIILIAGMGTGYLMYNKPHLDVNKEAIDINASVDEIVGDFRVDIDGATSKYYDKIILITGTFQALSNSNANVLINGEKYLANCELDTAFIGNLRRLAPGEELTVKGLFVGYDDLLDEIQLKKCIIE